MKRGLSPAFIDLFALMVVLFLLLPHRPETAAEADAYTGDLVVEISWCDRCHTDVDLWVRSPGDRPVGYSRLRGRHFSLFRDDLGGESVAFRGEIAAARVIPDGEYVVNLHLFSDKDNNAPVDVDVIAWSRENGSSDKIIIWEGTVTLSRVKQELTVVRWKMRDGKVDYGSIHMSPIDLRESNAIGAEL